MKRHQIQLKIKTQLSQELSPELICGPQHTSGQDKTLRVSCLKKRPILKYFDRNTCIVTLLGSSDPSDAG